MVAKLHYHYFMSLLRFLLDHQTWEFYIKEYQYLSDNSCKITGQKDVLWEDMSELVNYRYYTHTKLPVIYYFSPFSQTRYPLALKSGLSCNIKTGIFNNNYTHCKKSIAPFALTFMCYNDLHSSKWLVEGVLVACG